MLCGSCRICFVPDPFGALCIADSRAPLLSQPSLPSACRPQPRHRQYPPLFVLCSSRAASIGFSSLSAFQTVRTTLKSKGQTHGFACRFLAAEDPLNGPFGIVIHSCSDDVAFAFASIFYSDMKPFHLPVSCQLENDGFHSGIEVY